MCIHTQSPLSRTSKVMSLNVMLQLFDSRSAHYSQPWPLGCPRHPRRELCTQSPRGRPHSGSSAGSKSSGSSNSTTPTSSSCCTITAPSQAPSPRYMNLRNCWNCWNCCKRPSCFSGANSDFLIRVDPWRKATSMHTYRHIHMRTQNTLTHMHTSTSSTFTHIHTHMHTHTQLQPQRRAAVTVVWVAKSQLLYCLKGVALASLPVLLVHKLV